MERKTFIKGEFTVVPNTETLRGKPARMQLVHFWLCNYADKDGKCYPSRKRLAADCGMSPDTVDRAFQELMKLGVLNKQARETDTGDKDTNLYTIIEVGVAPEMRPLTHSNAARGSRSRKATVAAAEGYRTIPLEPDQYELEKNIKKSLLETAIEDFTEMRKAKKKPLTKRALKITTNKLAKWYPGREDLQVRVLENAIEHAWDTIWPLKDVPVLEADAVPVAGWKPEDDAEWEAKMEAFRNGGQA